jgi:hypothetical protein
MRNRRLAIVGLALVTALGLAGCGTAGDDATVQTPPSGAAAPAADIGTGLETELVAAATKLAQDTVKVEMEMAGAMSMTGVMDPKATTADMAMKLGAGTGATDVKLIQVKDDLYLKFTGSLSKVVGESWLHIDAASLKAGSNFNPLQGNDPAGAKALVEAMTNVQKVGDSGYRGTLDMTKAERFNKDSLKALGAEANAVPFTATVDGQGRLTSMNIEMGSVMAGAGTMKTTYSDFGTKVDVKAPPASQVKELPANMSGLLNA